MTFLWEAVGCPHVDPVFRSCAEDRGTHKTQTWVPAASPFHNDSQGTRNTTGWGPEHDCSLLDGRWECQPSAAPLAMTVAGYTHLSPSCGLGSGDPIRASSPDLCPGGQRTHVLLLSLSCGNLSPTRESVIRE